MQQPFFQVLRTPIVIPNNGTLKHEGFPFIHSVPTTKTYIVRQKFCRTEKRSQKKQTGTSFNFITTPEMLIFVLRQFSILSRRPKQGGGTKSWIGYF